MKMNSNNCCCNHGQVAEQTKTHQRSRNHIGQQYYNIPQDYRGVKTSPSESRFVLPDIQKTKLDRLPAPPSTLFRIEQLMRMIRDFSDRIGSMLAQNDIKVPPSIMLKLDSSGSVHVGEHPDKGKIERLFASNPQLENNLHEIDFVARAQSISSEDRGFRTKFDKLSGSCKAQMGLVDMLADKGKFPFALLLSTEGGELNNRYFSQRSVAI